MLQLSVPVPLWPWPWRPSRASVPDLGNAMACCPNNLDSSDQNKFNKIYVNQFKRVKLSNNCRFDALQSSVQTGECGIHICQLCSDLLIKLWVPNNIFLRFAQCLGINAFQLTFGVGYGWLPGIQLSGKSFQQSFRPWYCRMVGLCIYIISPIYIYIYICFFVYYIIDLRKVHVDRTSQQGKKVSRG